MRKSFIRTAVDLALAENGYPVSYYGWSKPGWLEVWDGDPDHKPVKIHLPAVSGFTGEQLMERLSVLQPIGLPLPAPPRLHPIPEREQIDLEAFLRALDARKGVSAEVFEAGGNHLETGIGKPPPAAKDQFDTYASAEVF